MRRPRCGDPSESRRKRKYFRSVLEQGAPLREADLGGYLVLRGEAPGDTLSPLTPAPIPDTSFNDTTVRRGGTYVYEVVAVDKETPPNRSAASNRVEETIR